MNKDNTTDQQLLLIDLDSNSTPETQIDTSNLVYFSLAKKEILQDKRAQALKAIERLSEDLKEM